jgi:sterol desaturase/sphingolipid hydroxylase (fatty acid hydroxylase superfamily)
MVDFVSMSAGEIRTAIPFFFALIFVEWLAGGARLYRLNDSIADLGAGIGQQVFAIPLSAILIWTYAWVFKTTALANWPSSSTWSWIAAFVLVDFAYYWFHRASHRVNFIWATHIVHHQSEEYNLTVALRQSWIQGLFSMVFYLPLATLGIPLEVALGAIALNTIGQFWFHTRAIGRMGWLELVLNTPSHHRVHHGRNPKYLDKNYAGVLIVWDRLFGTFVREEEEPVYGVVKPLNSWNVVWANTHQWVELARFCAAAKNWKERILVWFLPPARLSGPAPEVNAGNLVKFDARGTQFGQIYATFIFLTALAGLFVLNAHVSTWSTLGQAGAGALVIWTLASAGAFLEQKPWAKWAEAGRLVLVLAFVSQVW